MDTQAYFIYLVSMQQTGCLLRLNFTVLQELVDTDFDREYPTLLISDKGNRHDDIWKRANGRTRDIIIEWFIRVASLAVNHQDLCPETGGLMCRIHSSSL